MAKFQNRYYLAYGSNLNVAQMAYRCPSARVVGTATIKDYKLMFKGSKTGSYLTIEPCKGESVPVAVWMVSKADEVNLDHYEGYPIFYYKKEMQVDMKPSFFSNPATEKIKAFVYIMHEDREIGVPTRSYVETCWEGYERFGFNKKFLVDAFNYSKNNSKKLTKNA